MKTGKLRTRVRVASLAAGCILSGILTVVMLTTRVAFYFPPFWPGMFLSWAVIVVTHGEEWGSTVSIAVATIGNAVFYAWLSSRILVADIGSRGSLSRYFLR
jgi:hypothetical protein